MGKKKILFVGAIDAKVELQFMRHMGYENSLVYVTSYHKGGELARLAQGVKDPRGNQLIYGEGVDAANLERSFGAGAIFDSVVWIGPTSDGKGMLGGTSKLVENFVLSAADVIKPGGTVYVVQDLRNKAFRGIIKIPGAHYLCQVSLEHRTETQSATSSSKKILEQRKDHVFKFTYDESYNLQDVNNENNERFERGLTYMLDAQWASLNKKEELIPWAYTKKQVMDMIFDYAQPDLDDDGPQILREVLNPKSTPASAGAASSSSSSSRPTVATL